jgi:hypothetical protein
VLGRERLNFGERDEQPDPMRLIRITAVIVLIGAMFGCSRPPSSEPRSTASVSPTEVDRHTAMTSSTAFDNTRYGNLTGEVFTPTTDPEVVFTGPLRDSEGSLVVRYEPNSWYRDSGIASLPTVGDLQWFLDTEGGCQAVDRPAFIKATGLGHEVTITPAPGGAISIGESIPLWIEGDWLIHDGCSNGDPIIVVSQ